MPASPKMPSTKKEAKRGGFVTTNANKRNPNYPYPSYLDVTNVDFLVFGGMVAFLMYALYATYA